MSNSSFLDNLNLSSDCPMVDMSVDQLKERNCELESENELLKAQFAETIKQTEQIGKFCTDIRNLKVQNQELVAQNEDYENRLQMALQRNEDLEKQLEEETKKFNKVKSETFISHSNDIDREKNTSKKQISALNEEIEELKQKLSAVQIEQKTKDNKVEHLLNNASKYFNVNFGSVESCSDFISSARSNPQKEEMEIPMGAAEYMEPTPDYSRKIKSLKSKIKKAVIERKSLELNIADLTEQNSRAALEKREAISELKEAHRSEISALNEKFNKEKENLNRKLGDSKTEIAKLRQELADSQKKPVQIVKEKVFDEAKIEEQKTMFEEEKSKLKKQNAQMQTQLNDAKKDYDEIITVLNKANNDKTLLNSEIDKKNAKIASLKTEIEENDKEIKTLREALHTKEIPTPIVEKRSETDKLRIEQLMSMNETQNDKINELNRTIISKTNTVDALNKEKKELEGRVADFVEKEKEYKLDILEMQDKCDKMNKEKAVSAVPPSAFQTNLFGPDVSNSINAIANNKSFQIPSKIGNIYEILSKHMKANEEECNKKYEKLLSEATTTKEIFGKFIIDASVNLIDKAITINEFEQNNGANIIEEIKNLRNANDEMEHERDMLDAAIQQIAQYLGIQHEDLDSTIYKVEEVSMNINEQVNAIEILHQKYKKLKNQSKLELLKAREIEEDLNKENIALKEEREELLAEKNDYAMKCSAFEDECKKLNEQVYELQESVDNAEYLTEEKVNEVRKEMNAEIAKVTEEMRAEAEEIKSQLDEREKANANLVEHVKEMRLENNAITEEKDNLQKDFDSYKQQVQTENEKNKKLHKEEIENIQSTFSATVEQLKKQCEQHRNDIQKLASANSQAEAFIASSKVALTKINAAKRKAENDLKSFQKASERQKLLDEATTRTKILTTEAQCQSDIEQLKYNFETEKRKIFSSFVLKFKMFYNPSAAINERTYNTVVGKVAEELTRLKTSDSSIRSMTNASDSQTTEDSVAQILLQNC